MGIAMGASAGGSERTEYLYDGQMPVMEQDFKNGVLQQTRVHFLGARGIEAVVAIDHTSQGNPTTLRWLLYDGHGNLVRMMAPDYALSAWQFRGVWGEVQSTLGAGRGYCANLGHPEDETGLVYMRARYYEPATGRFISEDPARDGVNWYLYADGNPVNKVDGEGKRAMDPVLQVFIWGMLIGFFGQLGFYIGYGATTTFPGFGELSGSALLGAIITAGTAYLFRLTTGSEGLSARVPLRVGYVRGFLMVAYYSLITGWAAGALIYAGIRAGQVAFELFLMDLEQGLFLNLEQRR